MKLRIKKLHPDAIIPTKNNPTDGGIDVYALEDASILPGETVKVRTGIAIQLDNGSLDLAVGKLYVNLLWDRSGLGSKGIHRLAGVVDQSYTGEVLVCLTNLNILPILQDLYNYIKYAWRRILWNWLWKNDFIIMDPINDRYAYKIKKGDKIAQILIQEIVPVDIIEGELQTTQRGDKGFGSSGR